MVAQGKALLGYAVLGNLGLLLLAEKVQLLERLPACCQAASAPFGHAL